jgi:hypothetical protein
MPRPSIETARGWREKTMVDREGAPLGRIAHIYLDRVTEEPEWALVATGQGGRQVFVPLVDAAEHQDRIRVPVERALVSDAPAIRAGRRLSKEDTARLHGHYGGAPELRWASARRAPGGAPPARLRRVLGRARERAASPPAAGSPRGRLLLAAGAAASSVVGGVLLARRRRGRQSSGLAAAVGRTIGWVVAMPAGALRRRRRRRRLRALVGTAAAPLAAAGRTAARAARRVPVPTRTSQPRKPRNRRTRMAGNLKLLAGLAAGYVLGARAGRERYERIAEATRRLAERPQVRELTGKVRSGLGASLEKAAGTASDRLQQVRGEESGPEGQSRAEAGGPDAGERPEQWRGGQAPRAEAGPAAGEDHGRTRSQPPEADEADGSGRDDGGSSPEPGPSSRGRRERSRSGR